jgi:hypothetical protein
MSNNTWHIVPVDDLEPHLQETSPQEGVHFKEGEIRPVITCKCRCDPRIEYTDNDGVLVIHNAFDGREGLEEAKEILGL